MPMMDGGDGRNEAEKRERRRKRRRIWRAPAILKWTRSGGGHEGFTAPSPQAQHRPPPGSPELHSRCPDFPAPSSSGRVLTMPSGPSFAGKPALQLPGDQGHQLHLSILTMPRTQNSDNITVPTPTRRHLFIFFTDHFTVGPTFSLAKQVSKKYRPETPGLACLTTDWMRTKRGSLWTILPCP